jgi:hypothetical protein
MKKLAKKNKDSCETRCERGSRKRIFNGNSLFVLVYLFTVLDTDVEV